MWLPTKETQLPVKQIDENMEASIWLTVAQIMMEQNPFPEERKKREDGRQAPEPKKREEGDKHRNPSRNQEDLKKERREKKGDKHRNQRREKKETSTGTPAGTKRTQQIMERNPFPQKRKEREEGRQAPEPKKRE